MRQSRTNYLCICEGLQEKMYLKHLGDLVGGAVRINTQIGSHKALNRNEHIDYDCAVLFDHDGRETEFYEAIELCQKYDKKYRKRGGNRRTYHAYSNRNFDLWLLLHKEPFSRPVMNNGEYVQEVRRIYGLGNEDDIKKEANIAKILEQIKLSDVREAVKRAESIRNKKLETDGKKLSETVVYDNPDLSIHEFIKIVLASAGE